MRRGALLVLMLVGMAAGQVVGINGFVKDTTGAPMVGVIVSVTLTSGTGTKLVDTTEPGGNYYLELNSGWTGRMSVHKVGWFFYVSRGTGAFHDPMTTTVTDQEWRGYEATYNVGGQVTTESGDSIPGVIVTAGTKAFTTDYGWYVIDMIPYGTTVNIIPTKPGWVFTPPSVTINTLTMNTVTYDSIVNFVGIEDIVSYQRVLVLPAGKTGSMAQKSYDLMGRPTARARVLIQGNRITVNP